MTTIRILSEIIWCECMMLILNNRAKARHFYDAILIGDRPLNRLRKNPDNIFNNLLLNKIVY